MKTFMLSLLMLAGFYSASAQKVLFTIKSPELKLDKADYSFEEDTDYLIVLQFKDEKEASEAAKTLYLTKAVKTPTVESEMIKPEVNASDKTQLKISIPKAILKGLDNKEMSIYVGKELKFAFKLSKGTPAPPAATANAKAVFPEKVNEATVRDLKELKYDDVNGRIKSENISKDVQKEVTYLWNPATGILKTKDAKAYLHVGDQFYFQIDPVPNPYKYTVKISYDYRDHNDSTDSMLEELLLNPVKMLGSVRSLSSAASNDPEDAKIKERKNKALGYLHEANAAMIKFLDHYRSLDVIKPETFRSDKSNLLIKVNDMLKTADIGYNGDIEDYVSMVFEAADTVYVRKLVTNYRAIKVYEVPEHWVSMGQVQNFDELSYLVDIRSRPGRVTGLKLDTVQRFAYPVHGGFKVDVSPGLFYTALNQPLYSLNADSVMGKNTKGADTVLSRSKSILREKGSNGQVGFSTMVHFYWRWGTNFNVAASIGAGLTLMDKPQVRYFGGLSFLAGRVNRLALTVGYTAGRIEELNDRYYNADNSFKVVNNSETTLSTKKVLKGDLFISLGYNFPLLKRKP